MAQNKLLFTEGPATLWLETMNYCTKRKGLDSRNVPLRVLSLKIARFMATRPILATTLPQSLHVIFLSSVFQCFVCSCWQEENFVYKCLKNVFFNTW